MTSLHENTTYPNNPSSSVQNPNFTSQPLSSFAHLSSNSTVTTVIPPSSTFASYTTSQPFPFFQYPSYSSVIFAPFASVSSTTLITLPLMSDTSLSYSSASAPLSTPLTTSFPTYPFPPYPYFSFPQTQIPYPPYTQIPNQAQIPSFHVFSMHSGYQVPQISTRSLLSLLNQENPVKMDGENFLT